MELTGFWFNPNIHPWTEYQRRLMAMGYFAQLKELPMIYEEIYGLEKWMEAIGGSWKNKPERCRRCYLLRVERTAFVAKEKGFDVIIGKFPFSALGRALTLNKTDGFVKYVAEKDTGLILGVHAVGPSTSDIISEATLAIEMGAKLEDIASTIHPHPTLPESLMEAAEVTMGKAIHIFSPKK